MKTSQVALVVSISLIGCLLSCTSEKPVGLHPSQPAQTTVEMDFFNKPIPQIPLPNNLATRFDPDSATKRRVNASMVAPTQIERRTRELIDQLDGWGIFQPITIPFTAPIDVKSVIAGHRDPNYETDNDVVYLVNIDRNSAKFGEVHHLDIGNGNYPVTIERVDKYWPNDPRGQTRTIMYEEVDEDLNGNGILDLGEDTNGNGTLDEGEDLNSNGVLDLPEDTDADGLLDKPNYYPDEDRNADGVLEPHEDCNGNGLLDPEEDLNGNGILDRGEDFNCDGKISPLNTNNPAFENTAARSDAIMTFYEKQSHTLIVRPLIPLDERTTYAVVVTRRIKDENGEPVGSPFDYINHTAQTDELTPLLEVLPKGLAVEDIAFAYSYTTQTVSQAMVAVRDGLYGHGVQKHLGEEYPATLKEIFPLRDADAFPDMTNPHLLYSEIWSGALLEVLTALEGDFDPTAEDVKVVAEAQKYIDYFIVGSFRSPQLYKRFDADGNWLPLNDQSWPEDLDRVKAPAEDETVYFTLSIPRKEVSARGEGKPAPIVIQGHGYTGSRFEGVTFAGFHAKHGFATLSIDGPGHGLGFSDPEEILSHGICESHGIESASIAYHTDRTFNQNHDPLNSGDSGADFWTAYLFHTRDVVRQFALDYMQLIRIIRSFDGSRTWGMDLDSGVEAELAGDFDADGIIDVGKDSPINMVGGSLGGIMSMVMGGLEPELTAIAPVTGGAGYVDMGPRTTQGGAIEGFVLRAMAPIYTGAIDADGKLVVQTIVPNLNRAETLDIASIDDVRPWDTITVQNLDSGEIGCAFVAEDGTFRTGVASDLHARTEIKVYAGPQLVGGQECELREGATPKATINSFGNDVVFQDKTFAAGESLIAVGEGFGLKRAHPDLRRFVHLAQLVLDPADPGSYARHLLKEPLHYPGTNQKTGTHVLQITTQGDLAVPVPSGATFGRAVGNIDYLKPDARFDKTPNQMLIDTYTIEAVNVLKRHTDVSGNGVHLDVENFSEGTDMWGSTLPRIETPLRIGFDKTDAHGGASASIFPLTNPSGQHGFDGPRAQTQRIKRNCLSECAEAADASIEDPCGCEAYALSQFDIGSFMVNMIGNYFRSGGTELSADLCLSRDDCVNKPAPPEPRESATIP